MSVSRPARCLWSAARPSIPRPSPIHSRLHAFHQSHGRQNRKPKVPSVKASDLTTRNNEQISVDRVPLADAAARWRPYTQAEKDAMKHHYTPSQIAAIEAAESAVDPKDLAGQGMLRDDPWSMHYWDDLREIDPLVDKQPKAVVTDAPEMPDILKQKELYDSIPDWDMETTKAMADSFIEREVKMRAAKGSDTRSFEELLQGVRDSVLPQNVKDHLCGYAALIGTDEELIARKRLVTVLRLVGKGPRDKTSRAPDLRLLDALTAGNVDAVRNELLQLDVSGSELIMGGAISLAGSDNWHWLDPRYSALAPAIPKFDDPRIRWEADEEEDGPNSRTALLTGLTKKEQRKLKSATLVQKRVVNQTRMGKISSWYTLVITGNGNGLLGIGEGKSAEVLDSVDQARINAVRNMKPILRYENRTIYGEVYSKVGATEVKLMARPPG